MSIYSQQISNLFLDTIHAFSNNVEHTMQLGPKYLSDKDFNETAQFLLSHLNAENQSTVAQFAQTLQNHQSYNQLLKNPDALLKLIDVLFKQILHINQSVNVKLSDSLPSPKLPITEFITKQNVLDRFNRLLNELNARIDSENTFTNPHAVLLKLGTLINLANAIDYCDKCDGENTYELKRNNYPALLDLKASLAKQANEIFKLCAPFINVILYNKNKRYNEVENAFNWHIEMFLNLKLQLDYQLCVLSYQLNDNLLEPHLKQFSKNTILFNNYFISNSVFTNGAYQIYKEHEAFYKKEIIKMKLMQRNPAVAHVVTTTVEKAHPMPAVMDHAIETLTTSMQQLFVAQSYDELINAYKLNPLNIFHTINSQQHWADNYQAIVSNGQYLSTLDFNLFLDGISSLFVNPNALANLDYCFNTHLIPHIALGIGSDWFKYFNPNTFVCNFIYSQLPYSPLGKKTDSIYPLALFLVINVEKVHISQSSTSFTHGKQLEKIIDSVIEQFFSLYQGNIENDHKIETAMQLKNVLLYDLWPAYESFSSQAYQNFYVQQQSFMPFYKANVNTKNQHTNNRTNTQIAPKKSRKQGC